MRDTLRDFMIAVGAAAALSTASAAQDLANTTDLAEVRRAAEDGDAAAQVKLGHVHWYGDGVDQNYREAISWYRRAAEQGNVGGQLELGAAYWEGVGVPQDHAEAARWLRRAAEQGDPGGQIGLGSAYWSGLGVPEDHVEAHMWFNLAGAQGNEGAVEARDEVAEQLTREQLAEAQRRAREWFEGSTGEGTGAVDRPSALGERSGVYRPGAGTVLPRVLREVTPQYTAEALRARIAGTVHLDMVVWPDGTIGDVRVTRSLDPGLDEQAIRAAKQWRFTPGTRFGVPVPILVSVEFFFSLR